MQKILSSKGTGYHYPLDYITIGQAIYLSVVYLLPSCGAHMLLRWIQLDCKLQLQVVRVERACKAQVSFASTTLNLFTGLQKQYL